MTKIYLVRHGEVYNPNKVNYGRLPGFGLSESGLLQASKLKSFFAEKNISAIYSSPLLRTKQTAKIIADNKTKVHYSRKLIEVDFGKWQGKPLELTLEQRKNAHLIKGFPKESYQKVQSRMVKKILGIAKKYHGKNILIISHADPILATRLFFENKPLTNLEKLPNVNGSITTITFDDGLQCNKVEYQNVIGAKEDF